MAKANLTVQLDEDVIRRAKVVAAKRGTSVSALVAHELDALVDRHERYEAARGRAMAAIDGAIDRGGRTWTREELYADRLDRDGR